MKKNLTILGIMACLLIVAFMLGCTISTSGETSDNPTNLKFKAENIIFRNSTVKASDEFTDQKVYADDVVLNNANTSLTADNVQGAFEETQPKLSEIIVGEWDVRSYSDGQKQALQSQGTITFNADGSFSFTGSAGQKFVSDFRIEDGEPNPVKYIIYNESIMGLTAERGEYLTKIRDFSLITNDKLISKGLLSGYPIETIYILTRHTEQ